MVIDAQGLTVRTDSQDTIEAINRFIDQSLYYGNQAESAILQAVQADPTCAIAQSYAAAYYLSQETAIARRSALAHLKIAEQYKHTATEREQWYIRAISAWAKGAISEAIELHEAIAIHYPQDLISVQQGQYHYFYRGESERLLHIAQKVLSANSDHPHLHYLYGMIAFGFEQCGELNQAMKIGLQAIAINRFDPWAQHAIAHVLEEQHRPAAGIAWMENHADTWKHCNSMLYTHNWWHVALYYLALGDVETVLALYDQHVWGRANQFSSKDQVGAIATLIRLELQGVEVGQRWNTIAPYLRSRLHEHSLPFQDLHYIYALTRAGYTDWSNDLLQSWIAHVRTVEPESKKVWLEIVLPVAKGLMAHAQGNWSSAIASLHGYVGAQLQPNLLKLQTLGGSRTQQKLFQQIYQHSILQSNWLKAG